MRRHWPYRLGHRSILSRSASEGGKWWKYKCPHVCCHRFVTVIDGQIGKNDSHTTIMTHVPSLMPIYLYFFKFLISGFKYPMQPYWTPHNRTSARRIQNMGWRADGGLWLVVRGGGLYLSRGTGVILKCSCLTTIYYWFLNKCLYGGLLSRWNWLEYYVCYLKQRFSTFMNKHVGS